MRLLGFKRGNIQSYVAGMLLLFVLGFGSLFGYLWFSSFVDEMDDTVVWSSEMSSFSSSALSGMRVVDYVFVVVVICVIIGVGVTTYRVASSPIYFFVTFLLMPFLALLSYILVYTFSQIASNSVFSGIVGFFPRTVALVTNLHWILLGMVVVGSISMFAKRGEGQFV